MFLPTAGTAAALYGVMTLRDGQSWARSAIKGLAVTPLAIWALLEGAPLIAVALALCSLGDVILSRPQPHAFLAGLVAFALGHLAWVGVFVWRTGLNLPAVIGFVPLLLALALLLLGVVMARRLIPRAQALGRPVGVYILIIMAMGLAAIATGVPFILAGAVLFALSDALLGLQAFSLTAGSRAERAANALIWPLYWGAIVLLTLGTLPA